MSITIGSSLNSLQGSIDSADSKIEGMLKGLNGQEPSASDLLKMTAENNKRNLLIEMTADMEKKAFDALQQIQQKM